MSQSIAQWLNLARKQLAPSESARLDAELLLAHALQQSRTFLIAWPDKLLDAAQAQRFHQAIERRARGEPVAYITGEKEFWSLTLHVNPAVLIPRPETELLVELALQRIPSAAGWNILDAGTGSGAIALAIAKERPHASVYASDIHEKALATARANAQLLAIDNITFVESDLFANLAGMRFELIVSNPPYVRDDDPHLKALTYEPASALQAGRDGMAILNRLIEQTPDHLKPQGILGLEHGYDQSGLVCAAMQRHGYTDIHPYEDLAGVPRVVFATH